MRCPTIQRTILSALVIAGAALLLPSSAAGQSGDWLDQLTALVTEHRDIAKSEGREAAYDPYLAQLQVARSALNRNETEAVYVAMNQFMTMLDHHPETAGVPVWSAKILFDFCGRVTPPMYHDISRHVHDQYAGEPAQRLPPGTTERHPA